MRVRRAASPKEMCAEESVAYSAPKCYLLHLTVRLGWEQYEPMNSGGEG